MSQLNARECIVNVETGTWVYDTTRHWKVCTTCGCIHTKSLHVWKATTGGGYICKRAKKCYCDIFIT